MVPSNPIKSVLVFLDIFFLIKTVCNPFTNIIHLCKEVVAKSIYHIGATIIVSAIKAITNTPVK
jgi:hypothetical protein